jgi:hypothetical protein
MAAVVLGPVHPRGANNIVCIRISHWPHCGEHSACPDFRFSANMAAASACSGVSST